MSKKIQRCRSSFFAAVTVVLAAAVPFGAMGIAGCGSGRHVEPSASSLSLPSDETYNETVRAAGYTITDLGQESTALALNNRGQVLGSTNYAYLWTNGTRHYLGKLGTDKGGNAAISLSDSGQVIGQSFEQPRKVETATTVHPFSWKDGVFTPITVATAAGIVDSGASTYRAIKVNNSGQVLLERSTTSGSAYVLWKDGQSTPVSAVGINGNPLYLTSINNNGSFLGSASDSGDQFQETPVPSRTYLVKDGKAIDVGFLPSRLNTVPGLLNDNDAIVGVGFANTADDSLTPPQSYVWQNGAIAKLPGLPELPSEFLMKGFSNTGQIVGYLFTPGETTSACRYDVNTGTLVNLDTTVGRAAGWELRSALAINDAGQIIGEGHYKGKTRSYLLTPLP